MENRYQSEKGINNLVVVGNMPIKDKIFWSDTPETIPRYSIDLHPNSLKFVALALLADYREEGRIPISKDITYDMVSEEGMSKGEPINHSDIAVGMLERFLDRHERSRKERDEFISNFFRSGGTETELWLNKNESSLRARMFDAGYLSLDQEDKTIRVYGTSERFGRRINPSFRNEITKNILKDGLGNTYEITVEDE